MTPRQFTPSEKRTLLAIFAQHWENARHIKNERPTACFSMESALEPAMPTCADGLGVSAGDNAP